MLKALGTVLAGFGLTIASTFAGSLGLSMHAQRVGFCVGVVLVATGAALVIHQHNARPQNGEREPGRNIADEIEKALLIKRAIRGGRDVVARAAGSYVTTETVDLENWDAHHHTLARTPGAKNAYDRAGEVVARFERYNDHVTVQNTSLASEEHTTTVKYAGRAIRALDVLCDRLEKERRA